MHSANIKKLKEQGDPDFMEKARRLHMEEIDEHNLKADRSRMKRLQKEQQTRLDQIQLPIEGPVAFLRTEFQDRLNIDPDGRLVIQTIIAEGLQDMAQASALPSSFNSTEISAKGRATMKQSDKYKSAVVDRRKAALKSRDAGSE